jgi:hypothetical protein
MSPPDTKSPAARANAEDRANPKAIAKQNISTKSRSSAIDYDAVNRAAIASLPAVLNRLLPRAKNAGRDLVALNPRRADRNFGSFKINRFNCKWADFATGEKGGDPVSLVAYLQGVSQSEAARLLAAMLGLKFGRRRDE